jgi:hypothetical protein
MCFRQMPTPPIYNIMSLHKYLVLLLSIILFLNVFLPREICSLLDWCEYLTDARHSLLANIKLHGLANNINVKTVCVSFLLAWQIYFLENGQNGNVPLGLFSLFFFIHPILRLGPI